MDLTISDIEKDITGFEDRIALARASLKALPSGRLPFKEHKKREKRCGEYESEIVHVKKLIGIAKEVLEEVSQ